jgi:hypothetical protein
MASAGCCPGWKGRAPSAGYGSVGAWCRPQSAELTGTRDRVLAIMLLSDRNADQGAVIYYTPVKAEPEHDVINNQRP